jgi:hypothetical protein
VPRRFGLLRNIGDLIPGSPPLGLLDLFLVVKLIQKLPRRRGALWAGGNPVPNHLAQSRIFPQPLEVVEALAAHRVQNDKALHHRRFVVAPFPLLDTHVLPHTGWQPQPAERLHHQRHAAHGGECFR